MRIIRELNIVIGSIWLNVALFGLLILGAAGLMTAFGCYPDMTFGERLVNAFYMTRIESVPEANHHWVRGVLVFVMPVLAVVILGEGVLRVAAIFLGRKEHREEWEELMVKSLSGHTVLCGAGELGRALLHEMLERDPDAAIVVVDTHPGILEELGIRAPNLHQVQGDMTSRHTLTAANVEKASTILMTSGDDARNLEAAFKAVRVNPNAQVHIRLYRSGLLEMMDITKHPNLHFFSPYTRAAGALADELAGGGS